MMMMMYVLVFCATVLKLQINSAEISVRDGRNIGGSSLSRRRLRLPLMLTPTSGWFDKQQLLMLTLQPLMLTLDRDRINSVDLTREDKGEFLSVEKKRSLELNRYALVKPFVGRLYLVEDLQKLQRTLGSRYKQLLKVPFSDSFDSLVYSSNDFISDLRPIQKQLANNGTIPKLKGFVRILETQLSNYSIKRALHLLSKQPFLLVGDSVELKQIPARLVSTSCELYLVQAELNTYN